MGVLTGFRIVEIAGIGPAPFCGMLLADMGAEVILVERKDVKAGDPLDLGPAAVVHRGKRSLALDLKEPAAVAAVLKLIESADALIEGMRPGVMERLGLGPAVCQGRNPCLVYGRMTGWGQSGPLSQAAGHDINYIGLSGALWYAGQPGTVPTAPPTLVGDIGGGALYLAMGVLAAMLAVRAGGCGQVVDAAIVDGSANMMNLLLSLHATGSMPLERGRGLLDGPYWYGSYACADGKFVTVGALEPQFFRLLMDKLGMADDSAFRRPYDAATWEGLRPRLAALFASQPRRHWVDLLEGTDACCAPLLDPREAMVHPHMAARGVYGERDGLLQAAPAPRFSGGRVEPGPVPGRGQHSAAILAALGLDARQLAGLLPAAE